ncbi:MAG: endonuclease domain-containing protein [Chloroflexi bacterium]|nr:endonuclease domain-containing protein [Chloroflexota bacterium]
MTLARELRRKQTEAEKVLWSKLRNFQIPGVKFRRQQPIGEYIVDFVCLDKKLIIEIDGGQHNETVFKENDDSRTLWLESVGYRVIRFWNNEVLLNTDGVLTRITEILK